VRRGEQERFMIGWVAGKRTLVGFAVLGLVAAGCGGDDDTNDTAAPADDGGETQDDVEPVDEDDGGEEPAGDLPTITLGYLQVLGASESAIRLENDTKQIADMFGWDWVYCDAEGVPEQMQTCADSLMDQGADAIVSNGASVEVIGEQLARARDEEIPYVNTGGAQSDYEPFAAHFNPDEIAMGELLAEWVTENAEGGEVLVSSVGFTAWGAEREQALEDTIAGTEFEVADIVDVDFADVVGTSADATNNWLSQFPEAAAIWLSFDLAALGAGPIIAGLGEEPPERPLVVTFYANCITQDQVRAGGVDAVVEENLEWSTWVAMDQLAGFFASGTPLSDERRPTYETADGEEIQFSSPFIVTADDLPDECQPGEGPYPSPPDESAADFEGYFTERWQEQYGIS
jgi:ribose transport system substrate-binding protein